MCDIAGMRTGISVTASSREKGRHCKRSSRTPRSHRSMSGGRDRAAERGRARNLAIMAATASRRPACGAGRSASWRKASTVCCATGRGRRARRRSRRTGRRARPPDAAPPFEATHWTFRAMAKVPGIAASTVQGIWKAHGLAAPRRQFKLSNDPAFVKKLKDIVGLYVDPPAHAMVLSVERSPNPGARPDPARSADEARARRHDDPRLQAARHDDALRRAERAGWNRHRAEHGPPSPPGVHPLPQRHRERSPADKPVHAILDNYAAHKKPKVRPWLDRHPRWTFHFMPTSCSWLNAVEGFFAKLSQRRLKRGVFRSIVDLQAAINRFVLT